MAAVAEASPDAPRNLLALRRDWRNYTLLVFLFGFGFAIYSGVFQNFLRDRLHADALNLGSLESLREIPGLLTALMAGTLYALAESKIAAIGLLLGAVGIGLTGVFGSFFPIVAITVFWSVGFHLWTTMSSAITLSLAKGQEGGRHLGRMSGVGAIATISALGLSWIVSKLVPNAGHTTWFYPAFFGLAGVIIFFAGIIATRLSAHADGEKRQRIVFRKEYALFYLLTFLEGCRRQIFSIFASFALILIYHQSVEQMLLLQFVNSVLIAVTAPRIGRLVDRIGEKGPLTFYALGLIVVFLGYATVQKVWALYALFLIDNVLFSFGVGFTTYLHRIVRPNEMTPCLAMGVTMNHIAAVTVPVGGALLWKSSGNYQLPFWVGVMIAGVSLIATRWLPQGARTHAVD